MPPGHDGDLELKGVRCQLLSGIRNGHTARAGEWTPGTPPEESLVAWLPLLPGCTVWSSSWEGIFKAVLGSVTRLKDLIWALQ